MTVIVIAGWLCFVGLAVFLIALWWFDRRERKLREYKRIEISELAMIFQTLRDVVSEQKILAKEFNENVEEKIGVIKKIVNEARNKLAEVEEAIAKCNKRVQEIDGEIDLILSRVSKLKDQLVQNESGVYKTLAETENVLVEIKERLDRDKNEGGIEVKTEVEADKVGEGLNEIEFSEKNKGAENGKEEIIEKQNQISEEINTLKSAYNEILGLEDVEPQKDTKQMDLTLRVDDSKAIDLTPVQKIVLEYHKSGMTTSEIAKELGITKGEVRLILSLALAKIDKGNNE